MAEKLEGCRVGVVFRGAYKGAYTKGPIGAVQAAVTVVLQTE